MRQLYIIAIILFSISVLGQERMELLEKGRDYLREGSYDMARDTLEKVLANSDSKGKSELCRLYRLTGEYQKSLQMAKKMTEYPETLYHGYLERGKLLLLTGHAKEAKENFLETYRLRSDGIEAQYALGHYYLLHGQRDQYLRYFGDIFDNYDPYQEYSSQELLHIAKACRHYAMKMPNEEVDRIDTLKTVLQDILPEVIEKDKYNFEAYIECIELCLEVFNMNDAKSFIQDALKLNSTHPDVLLTQAVYQYQVYALRPKVLPSLDYVLKINPKLLGAWNLKAAVFLADEEYGKVDEMLKKAEEINSEDQETISLRAAYYYMQGRKTAYEKERKKVMKINPHNGTFYFVVAKMLLHKRKFIESVALNRKAIEIDPYLWHAYIELGRNLLNIGNIEDAEKYLDIVQEEYNFHVQSFNTRLLLKKYNEFTVYHSEHFKIRLHISEAKEMLPIVIELLEDAHKQLSEKFQFSPSNTTLFEMFPEHGDFAVRTFGLDALGASGACFGQVVALDSPKSRPKGSFNWASVVWHELTHVFTLQMTDYQIPRWFTEGLSEMSEKERNPSVDRKLDLELYSAYCGGYMRNMDDLNAGFTRPRYPMEVVVSYYQAKLVCEFIKEKYGFDKILKMMLFYKKEKKDREVFKKVFNLTLEQFDELFIAWLQKNLFGRMNVFPGVKEDSILDWQDELMMNSRNIEALKYLSLGYLQQNKFTDAEIYAGQLLSLIGDKPDAYEILGYISYQNGNSKQARKLWERAIKLGSKNFYTHWGLGMLYLHRFHNPDRAIPHFQNAKKYYPDYVRANNPYRKLAEIYFRKGDQKSAFFEMEEYLKREGNDFKNRIEMARKYFAEKRYDDVIRLLKQAQDIYPPDFGLHLLMAETYYLQKELTLAIKSYEMALILAPRNKRVIYHEKLTELYLEHKDEKKAKDHAEKALELGSNNEKVKKIMEQSK